VTDRSGQPVGEGRLVVGLVRGVHGLRGALRVEVLSDEPSRFEPGSVLFPEGSDRRLTVADSRADGPGLVVRFDEVTDRSAADQLRDVYLETEGTSALAPGEHYWHEVIGCAVSTREGEVLGTVEDVFRVGESEVYSVRGPRGEVLVPAVGSIVVELAPAEGRIVVDGEALGLEAMRD
jgi:16S rRNA processing protein RimM